MNSKDKDDKNKGSEVRHIFLSSLHLPFQLIDPTTGKPISSEESTKEPTPEVDFSDAKEALFKANQIRIIESVQQMLLSAIEKSEEPRDIYTLTETLRTNINILDDSYRIY